MCLCGIQGGPWAQFKRVGLFRVKQREMSKRAGVDQGVDIDQSWWKMDINASGHTGGTGCGPS